MTFRTNIRRASDRFLASSLFLALAAGATQALRAQVFVVGEKSAMAGVSTEFHPTKVDLPSKPIDERGRRTLMRDLEAEQGFAHRSLPLASEITLMANGNLTPGGDAYKELLYKKGQSAEPGDRVAISTVSFKPDRIVLDINGGPYLKHRILRHIELNGTPLAVDDGSRVTGFRVELVFEGGIPDVSAPEVKALLDPIIDFGVKSGAQAYADTLPAFIRQAVDQHDVLVGMNRKMVVAAMGAPESKVRELVPGSADKHYEEWIYGRVPQTVRFVRVEGDRVTQVRVAALGQPIATRTENEMQGFLDPVDTHEVAMGDSPSGNDADSAGHRNVPTLRKPGDPVPSGGSSQRVQYPVPGKEQPLPAAPGSPADNSSNNAPLPGPLDDHTGLGRTTPGSKSPTSSIPASPFPGEMPNGMPDGPQGTGNPATRVN